VLDVEPIPGRGQPEQHGQRRASPGPGTNTSRLRDREAADEIAVFQYICQAVARRGRGSEIRVDPSPELELEGIIVPNLRLTAGLAEDDLTRCFSDHRRAASRGGCALMTGRSCTGLGWWA